MLISVILSSTPKERSIVFVIGRLSSYERRGGVTFTYLEVCSCINYGEVGKHISDYLLNKVQEGGNETIRKLETWMPKKKHSMPPS